MADRREAGVLAPTRDLPRVDWPRIGGKGHYIQPFGTNNVTGMYIVEVPARGALNLEGLDLADGTMDSLLAVDPAEWREELRYNRSRAAEEYNFGELAGSLRDPKTTAAGNADTALRQQALERAPGVAQRRPGWRPRYRPSRFTGFA